MSALEYLLRPHGGRVFAALALKQDHFVPQVVTNGISTVMYMEFSQGLPRF